MEQILIYENNFDKARKLIKENKDKKIIFSSDDDELNRKILEKEDINVLLINQAGRKDFQKQRNSGFNHVLAKLAKKKNVIIGVNLDEIISSEGKQKAMILARVSQNIKICSKNKLKMEIIVLDKKNDRNVYDLRALNLVLGMPTNMIREL
ncbi:MAG: RNase P subunit p30 family protein [Candidatus Nanoarchaeia archaeon]|nr:RNase P subunit p30 family protein [Candidatus Nanoarchaeia archaeon]MDD5357906.1 RNase P subunit p30 family protein [Candidatus Nanoarchaeia archaeon]MDD5588825.1 RNase P subunit p30 family protein [Candidatus Nanoarchaeia archaeon]